MVDLRLAFLVLSVCVFATACTADDVAPPSGGAAPPSGAVPSWLTTADGDQRLALGPSTNWVDGPGSGTTVTVHPESARQTMRGFGASFTDSSADLVAASPRRDELMTALFDPVRGIGLTALRQPMGASDFSTTFSTYDDVRPGEFDWQLKKFSIDRDRRNVLPLLRQAAALSPALKVMATPWSPPAWMKDSGSLTGGKLNAAAFHTYAQYFVRFVRAYADAGIRVDAVTPQNEPTMSSPEYPSAQMTPSAQAAFIGNDLGPALKAAGLDTRILAYDHNWSDVDYPKSVLDNAKARGFVDGVAFHCYQGDPAAQQEVLDRYPGIGVHLTECSSTQNSSDDKGFSDTLLWQAEHLLIEGTRTGASSVLAWNVALDAANGPARGWCRNCTGLLTVDPKVPSGVRFNAAYYVLGHAGKFVVPGAVRVDSATEGGDGLESTAFRNPDGLLSVIVLNTGEARTFDLSLGGRHTTVSLPARSMATYRIAQPQPGG
ncbi:glycoside hydrolase family 30 protein [Amycolatopsis sp. CA-230715]|uniref:glycoside hydrolase family 30 protein n=1 Tax=Amycolatopsis sp. CA-230715 TaxID=2745196 RepID=UPI001C027265|nr:glycoside hydrolase family 30 beta sandwich domain-containing protein [Amycolatopsis sp. CA-230715]QWF77070.1 hypothetical protein HUW46_00450 [Amycolatopsis sp. CA-230715]